jgi:hypothetical protein
MKLQFDNVGRARESFAVEVDIDYGAQPEKFEKALRRELVQRGLAHRKLLDCMPTAADGAEGIVFAGKRRVGAWRRAGA